LIQSGNSWQDSDMSEQLLNHARVDRSAFSVSSLAEAEEADLAYWRQRTPDERLEALELSRQIAYGYDPTAHGLSRLFEVAESSPEGSERRPEAALKKAPIINGDGRALG
jgi:hypothetical protein